MWESKVPRLPPAHPLPGWSPRPGVCAARDPAGGLSVPEMVPSPPSHTGRGTTSHAVWLGASISARAPSVSWRKSRNVSFFLLAKCPAAPSVTPKAGAARVSDLPSPADFLKRDCS